MFFRTYNKQYTLKTMISLNKSFRIHDLAQSTKSKFKIVLSSGRRNFETNSIARFSLIDGFLQPNNTNATHVPSKNNNNNVVISPNNIFNMIMKSTYKTNSNYLLQYFQNCGSLEQLKCAVNLLFYKFHTPKEPDIIAALKACGRLISLCNKNKITDVNNNNNIIENNTVDNELSKYWIDEPENSPYTAEEVLKVAQEIFESIHPKMRTVTIYNVYIKVCGNAKRLDLVFSIYDQMKQMNNYYIMNNNNSDINNNHILGPNAFTYKALLTCCANNLNLDRAFEIIEDSTKYIPLNNHNNNNLLKNRNNNNNNDWLYKMRNIGIGMFMAKCIALGYIASVQDLDVLFEPMMMEEINKVMITGFGIGTFLCARISILTFLKNNSSSINSVLRPASPASNSSPSSLSSLSLFGMKLKLNWELGQPSKPFCHGLESITSTDFSRMSSPEEIRSYMYTHLIFRLLIDSHINEALLVFHHMTKIEIPLDIETFNGLINLICKRLRKPKLALVIIEKFKEHGIKPNSKTFAPIYDAFRNALDKNNNRSRKSLVVNTLSESALSGKSLSANTPSSESENVNSNINNDDFLRVYRLMTDNEICME